MNIAIQQLTQTLQKVGRDLFYIEGVLNSLRSDSIQFGEGGPLVDCHVFTLYKELISALETTATRLRKVRAAIQLDIQH